MMGIRFTKMQGLGNDFMVVDAIKQKINLNPADIVALSRRDTGVGFDQCLLIESSSMPDVDFFYRIFNADGTEVGQCGNGARCLARFVAYHELTRKQTITVATQTTRMHLRINPDATVTVDMGKPQLHPANIPLNMPTQASHYTLPLNNNTTCNVHAVSLGNPHAIMHVTDLTQVDVEHLGREICEHPLFPEQTNAGFMQIIAPNYIELCVYERGCGVTRACGSGAVAAVAIGRLYHQLDENVTVNLPGGELKVSWPNMDESIFLTGPAVFVYEGELI